MAMVLLLLWSGRINATSYYISNDGSDANNGTTQTAPWATFYHFNYTTLQAGDHIYLHSGSIWRNPGGSSANNYVLNLFGSGTADNPIVVTSYDSGAKPLIIGQGDTPTSATNICINAFGNSYLNISNIYCMNAWRGIQVINPYSNPAAGINISNCTIENISYYGLYPGTQTYTAASGIGFGGVPGTNPAFTAPTVTNCLFINCGCGLSMTAATNPSVANCDFAGCQWVALLFYLVNGGSISDCVLANNGGYVYLGCTAIGIQACSNVLMQNCIIHDERNGGGFDGDGIDFENSDTNCTVRNCYIYSCDGPGIAFADTGEPSTGIVIENSMIYNNDLNAWWCPSIGPANQILSSSNNNAAAFNYCCIDANSLTTSNFSTLGQWSQTGTYANAYQKGWTPLWGNLGQSGTVAVGGDILWGVQYIAPNNGQIMQWNGNFTGGCWNQVTTPGTSLMTSVGIGNDGTVWGVEANGTVWAYNGNNSWTQKSGGVNSISVGSASNIWGVNGTTVYKWSGTSWISYSQSLSQLSADANSPIVTGVNSANQIWRYNGSSWYQVPGPRLKQISAPGAGLAAGVDVAGNVWYTNNLTAASPTWLQTKGGAMRQVSVSATLGIWGVADDGYDGSVWYYGDPESLGAALSAAVLSTLSNSFSDPFSITMDGHWLPVNTANPQLVAESRSIPSGDGLVLSLVNFGSTEATGVMVQGTERWAPTSQVLTSETVSCSILPNPGSGGCTEQGIVIAAPNNFDFDSGASYITGSLVYFDNAYYIYITASDPQVFSYYGFPAVTLASAPCPGNPTDGQYHVLTLKYHGGSTSPMLIALWDNVPVVNYSYDNRLTNLGAGRIGLFATSWGYGDTFKFDNFLASWEGAPCPMGPASYQDLFINNTIDRHWLALSTTPAVANESRVIPSGDGQVVQFPATTTVSGAGRVGAMVVQGTEYWNSGTSSNETVSCSILPTPGSGGCSEQGVLINAPANFSFSSSDAYFGASLVWYNSAYYIFITCNDPAAGYSYSFPGVTLASAACPGNPADGSYHTLKLKLARGGDPMLIAYWDGEQVVSYAQNGLLANLPVGRTGVFAISWGFGDQFKFDNFQATWDNPPNPAPTPAKLNTVDWYMPQYVNGIAGRTVVGYCGPPPPAYNNLATLEAYGVVSSAFSTSVTTSLLNYTGLDVPTPSHYQLGVANSAGVTAGQMYQYSAGMVLNAANADFTGSGYLGMNLIYNWGVPVTGFPSVMSQCPWSVDYGPYAYFRMQTNFTLQNNVPNGSSQGAWVWANIVDKTTGNAIWYCLQLWNSAGQYSESVLPLGSNNFDVITYFLPNTKYCTLFPGSRQSNGSGGGNWYAAYVTRSNLLQAITDINNSSSCTKKFSTNPNDYAITYYTVGLQQYCPTNPTGWMGGNFSQNWAGTLY